MKKFIVFVLIIFAVPAYAQVQGVPVVNEDYYEQLWYPQVDNICGPTVMSEVIGYWSKNGYPNLAGEFDGTVPETSQAMDDLLWSMIWDYSGWDIQIGTPPENVKQGLIDYFNDSGYNVEIILSSQGGASWNATKAEIDAGRPVILTIHSIPHHVVVIGVNDLPGYSNDTLTVFWGHEPYEREIGRFEFPSSTLQTIFVHPQGEIADPSQESWYEDVMQWCQEYGWELEPID